MLAENVIWTGATDNQWDNAFNWNTEFVPGVGDAAFIIDGAVTTALIDSDVDLINGPVDNVYIGQGAGDGSVEIISGGNLTTTGLIGLGQDGGRLGSFNMTGGTLQAIDFIVGNNYDIAAGASMATISGGSIVADNFVRVASGPFSAGSTLEQTGGDITADNIRIADNSPGTYVMSAGTLTSNNTASPEFAGIDIGIGVGGGAFTFSGGTINANGGLAVGLFAPATFTIPIGSTGDLDTGAQELFVGVDGTSGGSLFEQHDGSVTTTNLWVGRLGAGASFYDISGGTLETNNIFIAAEMVADNSELIQSGGVIDTNGMGIGGDNPSQTTGGIGKYTITGGALNVPVSSTIQIGNEPGADGSTMTVSGGQVNIGPINPGAYARGELVLTAGADVLADGAIQIAATPTAAGSKIVQSGGLLDTNGVFVGVNAPGSIELSGGTMFLLGGIRVAETAAAAGSSITQTDGLLDVDSIVLGANGAAQYTQSGGVASTITAFSVGRLGPATYDLSGGSMTVANLALPAADADVNSDGSAVNISGGSLETVGDYQFDFVGSVAGASAALNLSGTADLSAELLIVGNDVALTGAGGPGLVSMTGENITATCQGIMFGPTGTLEVSSGSGASTLTTTADDAAFGGTWLDTTSSRLVLNLGTLTSDADLVLIENINPSATVKDVLGTPGAGAFGGLPEGTLVTDTSGKVAGNISYQYIASGDGVANDIALINVTIQSGGILGDLNCSGAVDAFDIDPFILALLKPAQYAIDFPSCDINLADINNSGQVDAFDIDSFIACVLNAGCP